jgi:hypothetical protein
MLVAMTTQESTAFLMLAGFLLSFYFLVIRKVNANPVIAEEVVEDINFEHARKHNERLKHQRKQTDDLKVSISFQEASKEPTNTITPIKTPKHKIENYTLKEYIQETRRCEQLLSSLRHTS